MKMSKFTKEMVNDYALKLLIKLTDETINLINNISGISEVEPMTHALDDFKADLREDIADESIPIEDLLSNADYTDGREIEVVKVVG